MAALNDTRRGDDTGCERARKGYWEIQEITKKLQRWSARSEMVQGDDMADDRSSRRCSR
jgi:hypothetical protein